ncbi:MAG: two-component system response regulator [Proteobacteria bacterium]|nr:MAG: two-component system response regulator [Pseudomonadota bacterium]
MPAARKYTVYVVDDDPAVLVSLRFLLETDGFDVRTFGSGALLLDALPAEHPVDCFVFDYKMDVIDGLELARRLRQDHIETPIVLITGFPDQHVAARAAEADIQCVLSKPHLEVSLTGCIQAAMRERPRRDNAPP